MKSKRLLFVLALVSFYISPNLFADNVGPIPVHGVFYEDLGVGWTYWTFKDERALVLPFWQQQFWGSKSFFATTSWRMSWGQPDYINLSYGTSIHYCPFDRIVDLSMGAYIGTFIFLDATVLVQPKVSISIPIGGYSYLTLSGAYNWELAIVTTEIEDGIGHIDGIEAQVAISTKIY